MSMQAEKNASHDIKNTELTESLGKLSKEYEHLNSTKYFADLILSWNSKFSHGNITEKVIVLGLGIPDELLRAFKEPVLWILGGSRESTLASDEFMPRDADPVSWSVFGYLCRMDKKGLDDKLFIIPLTCDSMRKIAYQLIRDGRKVCMVDFPPLYAPEISFKKWEKQLENMMGVVSSHLGKRLKKGALMQAVRQAALARSCMQEVLHMVADHNDCISLSARILVQNSYYYAMDLDEWTKHVRQLKNELRHFLRSSGNKNKAETAKKPKVLLMGSPVYFPNDKLPSLLTDAGMQAGIQADCSTAVFTMFPRIFRAGNTSAQILGQVAREWFEKDTSSAHIKNMALRRRIRYLAEREEIDGVIYHVLKGDTTQDFELRYFEEYFEKLKIPVFRLETDYQYQDIEQLRIRMEAFSEMLTQRQYSQQMAM